MRICYTLSRWHSIILSIVRAQIHIILLLIYNILNLYYKSTYITSFEKSLFLYLKKYFTENIIKIYSYFYFKEPRQALRELVSLPTPSARFRNITSNERRNDTRYIETKRSLPHQRNPGNNHPLGRKKKKSNCPLIHADTPPAGMPPRNDVRVSNLVRN